MCRIRCSVMVVATSSTESDGRQLITGARHDRRDRPVQDGWALAFERAHDVALGHDADDRVLPSVTTTPPMRCSASRCNSSATRLPGRDRHDRRTLVPQQISDNHADHLIVAGGEDADAS